MPALAAGCSVVIKPAEVTPLTTLTLARLASEAGLPDGVLNVVTGAGGDVGTALAGHRDVDLVTFTGSTAVGRKVMAAAARTATAPSSSSAARRRSWCSTTPTSTPRSRVPSPRR